METVIKINHITFKNTKIQTELFVFSGKEISNEKFQKNPESEEFKQFFSTEEIANILKNKTKVSFIPKYIHIDDTIDTIKRKIMEYISHNSFGEIYLFGVRETNLDTFTIYTDLTQGGKKELSKDGLYQFLQNITDVDVDLLPVKENYDYEDLLLLKLDHQTKKIKFPIGQRFQIDKSYHFTANPFDTSIFEKILQQYAEDIITTQNKNLLFDIGKLFNNTIFFCSAIDVLEYAQSTSLPEKLFIRAYYPFLYQNGIFSLADLKKQKNKLRSMNRDLINKSFKKNNDNVDLFYEIFYKRKNDLNYNFQGIRGINFVIRPELKMKIPLEILFKLIHASDNIPFIKYNPGSRLEKIYRLFTNQISKNGKKIPALTKAKIMRLRKSLAKHKQLGLFILYEFDNHLYEITCGFEKNGDININLDLNNIITVEKAERLIKLAINPILTIVGNFLGQSGYKYISFNNFDDKNIIIKNISYIMSINIKKDVKIQKFSGCLSSIFNIIQPDLSETIQMRFKRTAYFNQMESIDAFITEMFQKEVKKTNIINGLKSNFSLSEKDALEKFRKWFSQMEVEATLHENRKLRIKNNPGFPVFIKRMPFKSVITIQIDNINNINYLKTIPMYFDSLIRLTQDIYSHRSRHVVYKFFV